MLKIIIEQHEEDPESLTQFRIKSLFHWGRTYELYSGSASENKKIIK